MLKKNYEFKQVLKNGKNYSGNILKAIIIKNNKKNNFLGLAISTKIGNAVQRNRLKRLLRENYKNIENLLKNGYSIVFLIKKDVDVNNINFYNIKLDMNIIFEKANLLN